MRRALACLLLSQVVYAALTWAACAVLLFDAAWPLHAGEWPAAVRLVFLAFFVLLDAKFTFAFSEACEEARRRGS